jgi:hypothetical protein
VGPEHGHISSSTLQLQKDSRLYIQLHKKEATTNDNQNTASSSVSTTGQGGQLLLPPCQKALGNLKKEHAIEVDLLASDKKDMQLKLIDVMSYLLLVLLTVLLCLLLNYQLLATTMLVSPKIEPEHDSLHPLLWVPRWHK